MQPHFRHALLRMSLSARLIALRKKKGLTQHALADLVGLHVNQIRRYEAGAAQPSLDALKKLAQVFAVTTDFLLFEDAERGPDEDLKLQFEAVSRMSASEKKIVKALLEGMILKHETKRMVGSLSS